MRDVRKAVPYAIGWQLHSPRRGSCQLPDMAARTGGTGLQSKCAPYGFILALFILFQFCKLGGHGWVVSCQFFDCQVFGLVIGKAKIIFR